MSARGNTAAAEPALVAQIRAVARAEPTLTDAEIAEALGVEHATVAVVLSGNTGKLTESDIAILHSRVREIALSDDKDIPARTKLNALTWAVDEIKGRHDARIAAKAAGALAMSGLANELAVAIERSRPTLRKRREITAADDPLVNDVSDLTQVATVV